MSEPERWYSLDEIASHLGVSKDTVHRWIRFRKMPSHKVGRLWKFKTTEIDEWVKSGGATDRQDHAEKTRGL
jgi:excisionase family DNA binding protein